MGIYSDILICSDYDNTLTFEGEMSDKTITAITNFRKNGGTFVIVTGRGYNGTEYFNPVLKADGYLVVNNSTVLYKDDKPIEIIPFELDPMGIAEQILKNNMFITSFGVYWVEGTTRYYTDDISFALRNIDMKNVTKLSFFCDTEKHTDFLLEKAVEKFGDSCEISKALPDNFEIFSKNGGKGKMALKLKAQNCKMDETVLGDFDGIIEAKKIVTVRINK